ncbi:MAG: hypothetical protein H6502_05170 [Candidatus Woesearchaeota archaeon]|nr:MAG: hypothetical protein H6502_05170 [Candidatus Woesearchaeota archaeon]
MSGCKARKGHSAAGAGIFILYLTLAIILYILMVDPAARVDLLQGDTDYSSSGSSGSYGSSNPLIASNGQPLLPGVLFQASPGLITRDTASLKRHELPDVAVRMTSSAQIIFSQPSLTVFNSAFDLEVRSFEVAANPAATNNLLLYFNVVDPGHLIILVNGNKIYDGFAQQGSMDPIRILKERLVDGVNYVSFQAAGVGWQFWKRNQVVLSGVQITADIIDSRASSSQQRFVIPVTELNNVETATLSFFPECDDGKLNKLAILLNDFVIYESDIACDEGFSTEINSELLMAGDNFLDFSLVGSEVIVKDPTVSLELFEHINPLYTFSLDSALFMVDPKDLPDLCGVTDGVCPVNCEPEEDKDCCFADNRENFWCDVETDHTTDRCVGYVDIGDCVLCASGYEDRNGHAPDVCEGLCGDDFDDVCPARCSTFYDRDCCFQTFLYEDPDGILREQNTNYWCDDVPTTGLSSVCEAEVTSAECDDCPEGYFDRRGHRATCQEDDSTDDEYALRNDYHIELSLSFGGENGRLKRGIIQLNGREISFHTRDDTWTWQVDDYVDSGLNTIEIIPSSDMTILELALELDEA